MCPKYNRTHYLVVYFVFTLSILSFSLEAFAVTTKSKKAQQRGRSLASVAPTPMQKNTQGEQMLYSIKSNNPEFLQRNSKKSSSPALRAESAPAERYFSHPEQRQVGVGVEVTGH